MFKKENLKKVKLQAAIFGVSLLITNIVTNNYFNLLSVFITIIISEFIAYLSCYALVFLHYKNKPLNNINNAKLSKHIWINYIVWIILMNVGVWAEMLGL